MERSNNIIFSLVVPTFNSSVDLEGLLSSLALIKEELREAEIIVVDDGSCDDTQVLVRGFYGRLDHLNYFYQKNRGPGAARNLGAQKAKGKYLIFVDDDCLFPKGALKAINDFYILNKDHVGVGLKTTNSSKTIFTEFNQRLGDYLIHASQVSGHTYEYASSRCYSFVKENFLELNGHDEDFIWPAAEDRDLCLRLKKKNLRFGYIDAVAIVNTDALKWRGFIKQNFLYGLGAGLLREKHPDMVKASNYKNMIFAISKDRHLFKKIQLFLTFGLSQVCFLSGFILYKTNYDHKRRPPCVFLPKHVLCLEVMKNFILGIPFVKDLKKRSGSLTTGEELFSIGYMIDLAQKTADVYKDNVAKLFEDKNWFSGKRVLEIGPGSHLALPLFLIASGADKVVSIDKYGEVKFREKEKKIYEQAVARLPREQQERVVPLLKDITCENVMGFNANRINYLPDSPIDNGKINKQLPEAYFDLIVSCNTMEHIKDMRTSFNNMKKLLKKGGVYIHRIDGASHYHVLRHTKNKLSQLVFSDRVFDWMFSNRQAPTRRVLNDYMKIAGETGMGIDNYYVDEVAGNNEVNSCFKFLNTKYQKLSKEEIAKVGFIIVGMKK